MAERDDIGGTTVVVGVDGSDASLGAIRWAATHARATGRPLKLIHAVPEQVSATVALPVPLSVGGVAPRRGPDRPADRVLAQAAAEARLFAPDVEVSGRILSGGAAGALVDASARAGLVVVGSRGLGRVSGALTGSVGLRVAAQAHCPAVVVRGEATPGGPVMVAVDGSPASEAALRFGFAEAARQGTRLLAVHAWTPPVVPVGAGHALVHAMAAGPAHSELRRAAERTLTAATAAGRAGFPHVDVVEQVLDADPGTVLPESAEGAALAVLGTRGRGGLSGLLLGSTSQAMLARAGCPVAVVREPGD